LRAKTTARPTLKPSLLLLLPPPARQCAVPLQSIVRSPQIEGYRNKAEFTIGLDAQDRPAVGFLLGSFKVGLWVLHGVCVLHGGILHGGVLRGVRCMGLCCMGCVLHGVCVAWGGVLHGVCVHGGGGLHGGCMQHACVVLAASSTEGLSPTPRPNRRQEGFVAVADPSACRHMSPTSLAYAALTQQHIRASSKLPVWDKRRTMDGDGKVSKAGFWRLLVVREGRDRTFMPIPVDSGAAAAAGGGAAGDGGAAAAEAAAAAAAASDQQQLLTGCPLADVPIDRWDVGVPAAGTPSSPSAAPAAPSSSAAAPAASSAAARVSESEPPAPPPDHVLLMLQVNPAVTDAATLDSEVRALAAFLQDAAKQQGLPLTSIWVQHHSGVANAAPADAHTAPLPGFEGPEGLGGVIQDSLCELRFRISPLAFFQVRRVNGGGGFVGLGRGPVVERLPLPRAALDGTDRFAVCCSSLTTRQLRTPPPQPTSKYTSNYPTLPSNQQPASNPSLSPPPNPKTSHQINAGATCLLYHLAGSWAAASPSTLLLDICCGTGTIGISLAGRVKAVVGIDNVASAVADAGANAAANGVGNATWVCGNAEKVIQDVLKVRFWGFGGLAVECYCGFGVGGFRLLSVVMGFGFGVCLGVRIWAHR